MDMRNAVLQGYSDRIAEADGAVGPEAAQVCRMNAYDPKLLNNVPQEIIDRDYGCGNPSKYAKNDLASDLEIVEQTVANRQIGSFEDYASLQDRLNDLRKSQPMIRDGTVDLVVSNCVINLVDTQSKGQVLSKHLHFLDDPAPDSSGKCCG